MTSRQKLENILENEYCFRDYDIVSENMFGKVNSIGVHAKVDPEHMNFDVNNALETLFRDGYPHIFFYIEKYVDNRDNVVNLSEYRAKGGLK